MGDRARRMSVAACLSGSIFVVERRNMAASYSPFGDLSERICRAFALIASLRAMCRLGKSPEM